MAMKPCKAIAPVIAAFNSLMTAGEPWEGVSVDIDKFCSVENLRFGPYSMLREIRDGRLVNGSSGNKMVVIRMLI